MEREMDSKRQCYWWWFDSHKSSRSCSPWLQSTLTELNEKTKTMLKLIDEDADSFAQRAEMYYKKRPELISIVEDFYRAHRSLAERYDQLRFHHAARAKSPLRLSFPLPKSEYDNAISSIKCFDSLTDGGYNSEESEIHDPECYDTHVEQNEPGTENPFLLGASYDELLKLKDELGRLQEENEFQRSLLEQKAKENEELMKQTSSDLMKLKDEVEILKEQNMKVEVMLKHEEEERIEVQQQFEASNYKLMKVRDEMQAEIRCLKESLLEKDERKREVIRQLSVAMELLREENQHYKKLIRKNSPKKPTSFENPIFKGIGLGRLFGMPSKSQSSTITL